MLHNTNRDHQPDSSLQNVLFSHQNQLFECYSKLLMLRVDFAYRQNSDSFNAADANQLVADMTWLTEQCTTLSGLVGYAWVLEYTEDHSYRIHTAIAGGREGMQYNPELLRQAAAGYITPDLQSQRSYGTSGERQITLMCSRTLIQFYLTVLRIGITKFITVDGFHIQHKVQLLSIL